MIPRGSRFPHTHLLQTLTLTDRVATSVKRKAFGIEKCVHTWTLTVMNVRVCCFGGTRAVGWVTRNNSHIRIPAARRILHTDDDQDRRLLARLRGPCDGNRADENRANDNRDRTQRLQQRQRIILLFPGRAKQRA